MAKAAKEFEPLAEWSRVKDPLVLRPFAGTGLFNGVSTRSEWVGSGYFRDAGARLNQTWTDAAKYGVKVADELPAAAADSRAGAAQVAEATPLAHAIDPGFTTGTRTRTVADAIGLR